jgi:hypothetical protein
MRVSVFEITTLNHLFAADCLLICFETPMFLSQQIIVQGSCKETINLLSEVRQEINAALEFKAMHPRKALPDNLQTIINAVADMYCMLDMELDGEAEEEEP